jgi:hypothetical protein
MKYFDWAVIILALYLEVSTFVICRMSCFSSFSFDKYTMTFFFYFIKNFWLKIPLTSDGV